MGAGVICTVGFGQYAGVAPGMKGSTKHRSFCHQFNRVSERESVTVATEFVTEATEFVIVVMETLGSLFLGQ